MWQIFETLTKNSLSFELSKLQTRPARPITTMTPHRRHHQTIIPLPTANIKSPAHLHPFTNVPRYPLICGDRLTPPRLGHVPSIFTAIVDDDSWLFRFFVCGHGDRYNSHFPSVYRRLDEEGIRTVQQVKIRELSYCLYHVLNGKNNIISHSC